MTTKRKRSSVAPASPPAPAALLIRVRGDGAGFAAAAMGFAGSAGKPETLFKVPSKSRKAAFGPQADAATWLRVPLQDPDANPWDAAHAMLTPGQGFSAAAGARVEVIEPDFNQQWTSTDALDAGDSAFAANKPAICAFDDQETKGGKAIGNGIAWNFDKAFSGLADARANVGTALEQIIIAHLDTGYDPDHLTRPKNLDLNLQHSFVKADPDPNDATDKVPPGMELVRNRGHGTGTLSLLAGNRLDGTTPSWPGYKDYIGGAPLARVIPVRIADWVVRFSTSTMVLGMNYAREQGAHVLSMSMGGLSSSALVDAVNLAYDAGLVLVTAGGNNIAGVPSPKSIVFPARLKRVLAACGLMADGRAYAGLKFGTMQGNYGPASKMETAIGAYTPNVPWAQIDCGKIVDMNGAGTSSATPQVAAAVALWLAKHWNAVQKYSQPWMRVEAVRYALRTSAQKFTPRMKEAETIQKIGQGVLRALDALNVQPPAESQLVMLPPAKDSWSWLNLFVGGGVSLAPGERLSKERAAMLGLELTQLAQRIQSVDEAIDDPDRPPIEIPATARNRYFEAALDSGYASNSLRQLLEGMLGRSARVTRGSAQGKPAASSVVPGSPLLGPSTSPISPIKRKSPEAEQPHRRLRVYALDPSVAKSLASQNINQTVLSVPWDDKPQTTDALKPGPIGEYLEVVDVDPASNRIYEPLDLNDRGLLALDGYPPSEGDPQFHQQMVYAVGMTTIGHFERALGRRALWAPRVWVDDEEGKTHVDEVPQLRIYPHALRARNAYYSPEKKALLFGYFPAESRDSDTTAPGSMVFSCLSSDIIAHEMTHALLDGLNRHFQEASNPDVPAFHEAFADIVALFQHFMVTELVRFEIGRVRGDLTAATLLSGLAKQFGEGSSRSGPLRDYLDPRTKELNYAQTLEPHDRGSILVFAVYEAFLKALALRTSKTIRLATGGSGILPAGTLHPDLVNRLTKETCETAQYTLEMCIRALDYLPPVDITFGEYLRAVITADRDVGNVDRHGYRVAFMEAFRNRGILPRDVRTVSEETLAWGTLQNTQPAWLAAALEHIKLGWDLEMQRSDIFDLNEANRKAFRVGVEGAFKKDPSLYIQLGLLPNLPRYDEDGEWLHDAAPGESTFDVFSVRPARRVASDGSYRTDAIVVIQQRRPIWLDDKDHTKGFFWFRGGATLILDVRPNHQSIRYSIIKNSGSASRLERQRSLAAENYLSPLRALYFGKATLEPFAIMHADAGECRHG